MKTSALFLLIPLSFGQSVRVVPAPEIRLPAPKLDGNNPAVWVNGELNVYTSTGIPVRMNGPGVHRLSMADAPVITTSEHLPLWIESVWRDDDGILYAWYHHEPMAVCDGNFLTAPKIGALVSRDGGQTFDDLGIVLENRTPMNCDSPNGYFGAGNGDFSVILDRERKYFYFFFTNYGGPLETQGVAMARMAFEDRIRPVGSVYKFAKNGWTEPGLGGDLIPILNTRVSWDRPDTDSFWGPAIHWNSAIEKYVVLLNRACCEPRWPQEGVYVMYGDDLSDPDTWTKPRKILDDSQINMEMGYYPQVMGNGAGETDTLAGNLPRLFIEGVSRWVLQFSPQPLGKICLAVWDCGNPISRDATGVLPSTPSRRRLPRPLLR